MSYLGPFLTGVLSAAFAAAALSTGCAAPCPPAGGGAAHAGAPATRPASWSPRRTFLGCDRVEIPLRFVAGEPYATVGVGKATASFLIDTGSNTLLLLPKLAADERLPLQGKDTGLVGDAAGGSEAWARTHLRSISMGKGRVRFEDLDARVSALPLFDKVPKPADFGGIVGWPVFSDVLLTFDYPRRVLVLSRGELPPPDGEDVLPIRRTDQGLFIPASLNGEEIWLYPDTGSNRLTLPASRTDIRWASPPRPVENYNAFGVTHDQAGRIEGDLRLGRYVLPLPEAVVSPARTFGIAGNAVLRNFVVTFDLRNLRMMLQRTSAEPIEMP